MLDCLIIGGGIIGLSTAYELARQGAQVHVIDCRRSHRTASWAAAGILPPPISRATHDAMEQLRDLSHRLYPDWCEQLQGESGVDVQFNRCGGIYLARKAGETASLQASLQQWQADGVRLQKVDAAWMNQHEPALSNSESMLSAYLLPDEATVRPPRLLDALSKALASRGVTVDQDAQLTGWRLDRSQVKAVETTAGRLSAKYICVATGPWSHEALTALGVDVPVEPIRGQMIMWHLEQPIVHRVINEGPRYLLARKDGQLLAGSTVEEVGFDDKNTLQGIAELTDFATGLIPSLPDRAPTASWAGLRPGSRDGFPYLGRLPRWDNVIVATGHFRSGIHLAPATAKIIGQLVNSRSVDLDLTALAPSRP